MPKERSPIALVEVGRSRIVARQSAETSPGSRTAQIQGPEYFFQIFLLLLNSEITLEQREICGSTADHCEHTESQERSPILNNQVDLHFAR